MERQRILKEAKDSGLPLSVACKAASISRSTYWRWQAHGGDGKPRGPSWNALTEKERTEILATSEAHPDWSSRQIACSITDATLRSRLAT